MYLIWSKSYKLYVICCRNQISQSILLNIKIIYKKKNKKNVPFMCFAFLSTLLPLIALQLHRLLHLSLLLLFGLQKLTTKKPTARRIVSSFFLSSSPFLSLPLCLFLGRVMCAKCLPEH